MSVWLIKIEDSKLESESINNYMTLKKYNLSIVYHFQENQCVDFKSLSIYKYWMI
jgi:hypothetical protein